ncbi:hypothetical protein [Streptacidiphilus jiangxiensis]|uniref:Uncharacterized protein n=1 Tax=Streptacidiphilus jiangxiensis TaxID=235985 RepID=A0A1H8AVH0_STRJI|nr:hypothetical protein [Streptacidiphilus jiangxiensis]SEM74685.1 hypothetical protein SAMN05414137_15115 [Streptacidiphilus jiangxiensis]
MLVVQGGPATALVRDRRRASVVLFTGDLPVPLTGDGLRKVLDLAAAVLSPVEAAVFRNHLLQLSRQERASGRCVEIDGAVLSVHPG